MAIQHVSQPTGLDGSIVHVMGEPDDVERMIGREQVYTVTVGGYDVMNVADAHHDGLPAKRFTLGADNHEVGRLVLRTGVATEYLFEFSAIFETAEAASAFVDRVNNPPAVPKVCQSIQDLSYQEQTLEEAISDMSAAHGVSIQVLEPSGPGGGWPVVKIYGRVSNVRSALMDEQCGWGYTEDDAERFIEPFTV